MQGFRIQGAILIGEAELQAQLSHAIGKEYSLAKLQTLTLNLVGYYARKGYVARVVLPPQEIVGGIVEIRIIEGKRGSLNIDNQGKLIDSARVQGFIDQRLPSGAAMDLSRLGEAMNILNDQPGIEAKTAIVRGSGEGDVDLVVTAADKPLVTTDVGVNNQGSRGTGEVQAQGSVVLNNPTGRFDAASLLVNANKGSTYLRADYSLAVGDTGLRMGVNASRMRYEVVQPGMTNLDPHGTAGTYGINASYPLSHREDFKFVITGSYDDKTLIDQTSAGETSDQEIRVTNVGFSGVVQPIATTFGVGLSVGDSNQGNEGARTTDSVSRGVEGSYTKLSYNFGHIRPIAEQWSISTALRGQFANKNLNSTERFNLGGPKGVRSYPAGEAGGDEGWLLNIDLRKEVNQTLAATIFADAGSIKVNDATWDNWNTGNTRLENRYELYGVGAGFDWRLAPNAVLSMSMAVPIGENPGRDINDRNSDSRDSDQARIWFSLGAQF